MLDQLRDQAAAIRKHLAYLDASDARCLATMGENERWRAEAKPHLATAEREIAAMEKEAEKEAGRTM